MQHVSIEQSKNPRESSMAKRDVILEKAYKLAKEQGFEMLTRNKMAEYMGIAPTSITYYFTSPNKVRDIVLRRAIAKKDKNMVIDGLCMSTPAHIKAEAQKLLSA